MPLNPLLENVLSAELLSLLRTADETGNLTPLQERLNLAQAQDQNMLSYNGERGTKYYKPFIQTVVPKIIPAFRLALEQGTCPEIEINYTELDATRHALNIPQFGSPQDVLYGFTSERYPHWGITLETMGFTSACMTGEGTALVTMAPRYLSTSSPDMVISELEGAIARDFWESTNAVFSGLNFKEDLEYIISQGNMNISLDPTLITSDTPSILLSAFQELLNQGSLSPILGYKTRLLLPELERIAHNNPANRRRSFMRRISRANQDNKVSQEQIALKYMEEGNFLQKLLGGARVDHIQSNVKMIKNLLRNNKCEVDSIYRVTNQKRLVLVEAKDKPIISRGQLYQLYETFRLRLPANWSLDVIALLRSDPTPEDTELGYSTYIDLIKVGFDDTVFGNITQSLFATRPTLHYRWQIRRQSIEQESE